MPCSDHPVSFAQPAACGNCWRISTASHTQANYCAAAVAKELESRGQSDHAKSFLVGFPPLYYSRGSPREAMRVLLESAQRDASDTSRPDFERCASELAATLGLVGATIDEIIAKLSTVRLDWQFFDGVSGYPLWNISWASRLDNSLLSLAELLWAQNRFAESLQILGDCDLDYLIILLADCLVSAVEP